MLWTQLLVEDRFVIWNLGYWDLFEIWVLELGIYIFNQTGRLFSSAQPRTKWGESS